MPSSSKNWPALAAVPPRQRRRRRFRLEIYDRFLSAVGEAWDESLFPRELGDIGARSEPEGYLGLVFCDGNRMGDHFSNLNGLPEVQNFSEAVHNATENGALGALRAIFRQRLHDMYPFEFVLLGGDDLAVIVPAHCAVTLAVEFMKSFVAEFDKEAKDRGLDMKVSVSSGVAIAHTDYPITSTVRLAEELLKSAKKKSFAAWQEFGEEKCTLDFQAISSPAAGSLKDMRDQDYHYFDGANTLYLTQRPYELSQAENLLNAVRFINSGRIPANKLEELYRLMGRGYWTAWLQFLILRERLKDNAKKALDQALAQIHGAVYRSSGPWMKRVGSIYQTDLIDLIELAKFS